MLTWILLACLYNQPTSETKALPPQVRYRPSEPSRPEVQQLIQKVPNTRWDRGLQSATDALRSVLVSPISPITIEASRVATDRAGYPGQVRFAKLLNGGAFPDNLLTELKRDARQFDVDVAIARRDFGDGGTLWLLAWSPRLVSLEPLPRDLSIDSALPFYVELSEEQTAMLYISSPGQPIRTIQLLGNAHRLLKEFYVPGVHRLEVVTEARKEHRLHCSFRWVDQEAPELNPILPSKQPVANPRDAEKWLLAETNRIRLEHGLHSLEPFNCLSRWLGSTLPTWPLQEWLLTKSQAKPVVSQIVRPSWPTPGSTSSECWCGS